MRFVAIDWSGKVKGAEESIWLAVASDRSLTDLENGMTRERVIDRVISLCEEDPETVVGFDFAFSFPRWWCEQRGWSEPRHVWSAMVAEGDGLLAGCDAPFWGRPGRQNPNALERRFRRTELEVGGAKSVFQIGGAGAVGTGSIRGMPHLLTLAERGFAIWPFDEGWPRVVEIYPRLFTGRVKKSRWRARLEFLEKRYPDQARTLIERAAGSEDAFDAAASVLEMARHDTELRQLTRAQDRDYAIEGKIWAPTEAE